MGNGKGENGVVGFVEKVDQSAHPYLINFTTQGQHLGQKDWFKDEDVFEIEIPVDSDGEEDTAKCEHGHGMAIFDMDNHVCDECGDEGTGYRRSLGCDFDL